MYFYLHIHGRNSVINSLKGCFRLRLLYRFRLKKRGQWTFGQEKANYGKVTKRSWNSNTLATSYEELTHWKRPWCCEGLGAGGEGDDRGWDGWMASLTRWTWVWVNSGSWCWTGRPGMLRFVELQRVGHDWVTELNWTKRSIAKKRKICCADWCGTFSIDESLVKKSYPSLLGTKRDFLYKM